MKGIFFILLLVVTLSFSQEDPCNSQPYDKCQALNCSWCSPEGTGPTGQCYNKTISSCCGMYGQDCYNPILCNASSPSSSLSSPQSCCMPLYDCEYAGSPTCCDQSTTCCSARHSTSCCGANTTCCSPNTLYSTCCNKGGVCCGTLQSENVWCCPSKSTCGSGYNNCTLD